MLGTMNGFGSKFTLNNKGRVMRCIINNGPINRAVIAKKLHLSIPTVMSIVGELTERGHVCEVGKGASSGGKRPVLLSAVSDSEFYMGVDIGRGTIRVVIENLCHTVVYSRMDETGDVVPPEYLLQRLLYMLNKSIAESRIDPSRLVGIGVAMPGLIQRETGTVLFSPVFGWSNVPLQSWLQEHINYPVLVENSNRAMALEESLNVAQHGNGTNSAILCVNFGHGIGGALLQNNELYYGSNGISGEIGHIPVNPDGPRCGCGNYGCLEAVASGDAIARQATEAVEQGRETCLLSHGNQKISAKMVFAGAVLGDALCLKLVDDATKYIGIGLTMAINVFDPDCVILCGGLTKNGSIFVDRVSENIKQRSMRWSDRKINLQVGSQGEYSTALGAAKIVTYNGWRIPKLQYYYSSNGKAVDAEIISL